MEIARRQGRFGLSHPAVLVISYSVREVAVKKIGLRRMLKLIQFAGDGLLMRFEPLM